MQTYVCTYIHSYVHAYLLYSLMKYVVYVYYVARYEHIYTAKKLDAYNSLDPSLSDYLNALCMLTIHTYVFKGYCMN